MTRRTLLALAVLPLAAMPARSQTTDQQAQDLKAQLQQWVAAMLGPDIPAPPLPVEITADGDHYGVAIPFGAGPDALRITGEARPAADGRWTVDDIKVPSPATLHFDLPPQSGGQTTYTISIADQATTLQLDPSLRTTTTWSSTLRGIDGTLKNDKMQQSSHYELGSSSATLQPSTGGRVTFAMEANIDNYTMRNEATGQDGQSMGFQLGIGKGQAQVSVSDVSPDRLREMIHLGGVLAQLSQQPANKAKADEAAAALFASFSDFASAMSFDETVQNLTFDRMGIAGALRAVTLGFGVNGNNGRIDARLDLGAEGLTLPDLGLGALAELIPTKVTLRPVIAGIPAEAVNLLLKDRGAAGGPSPEVMQALFSRGPIVVGLENLTLDVAGSELTGLAKVTVANPQDIAGTGQIAVTNLDALQQRLSSEPQLAGAMPVLIFLKGIGRVNGNQTVWEIDFHDGRLLVNGTDMSALAGGPPASPPPATRPAPPPPSPTAPPPALRRRP